MRILVVEDELIVAFHLEAALLEEGHRVVGFARCPFRQDSRQ